MPAEFGFFTCDARRGGEAIMDRIKRTMEQARRMAGHVDAIVFPEGSLIGDEYIEISKKIWTLLSSQALRIPPGKANRVRTRRRSRCLTRPAISPGSSRNITAGGSIGRKSNSTGSAGFSMAAASGGKTSRYDRRSLNFLSLNRWLTLTVLICEDLARMDPVTELVRSVGPNLVITLLLDGPQLAVRWPARYATVLAEDPGSSVLTLTAAGMVGLSRPVGSPRKSKRSVSHVVALWKDVKHPPREIKLEAGSAGVLLELQREESIKEWTADGREDGGTTAYLICTKVRQVRMEMTPVTLFVIER